MRIIIHRNKTYYGQNSTVILAPGFAYAMISVMDETPDAAVIHDLCVYENKRGIGFGTDILEAACKEANQMGVECIRLCVEPDSWMEEWYKRHGFKDTDWHEDICGVTFKVLEKPCKI